MSRRHHSRAQSAGPSAGQSTTDEQRARTRGGAAPGAMPAGAAVRPILPAFSQPTQPSQRQPPSLVGSSFAGNNTTPVEAYQPRPGVPAVSGGKGGVGSTGPIAFAPGDPIRPAPGLDDGWGGPRQWAYPTGVNVSTVPRQTEGVAFTQLRNLSELYEGVQLCEEVIFRILDRLDLQLVPHPDYLLAGADESDPQWQDPSRAMRDWLLAPHRDWDLHGWMRALMRELLELDACGIYHEPTRGGGLAGLRLIAGDTLIRLADTVGGTPQAPYPAFLQVVNGAPAWIGDRDSVDYLRVSTRVGSLYGRPPVEQVIYRVNTALRKEHWDITRFTDGSTPEGIMETDNPALFGITPDLLTEYERMFNAILAGNDAMRMRVKFNAPGFHYKPTKPMETSLQLDQYLLNITVTAFGLTMDELGFTGDSNRSVGKSQEDVIYRNAVRPRTDFIARYLSSIIRRYDGLPLAPNARTQSRPGRPTRGQGGEWDGRFVVRWAGIEEPEDWNQRAFALKALAQGGILSPTEVKHLLKLPVKANETFVPPYILAPAGSASVVFPGDLAANREQINAAQQAQLAAQTKGAAQQVQQGQQQQQQQDLAIQQSQVQLEAAKHQLTTQKQLAPHQIAAAQLQTQQAKQATQQQQPQQQPQQQQPAQQGQPSAQGAAANATRTRDLTRGPAVPPLGGPDGGIYGALHRGSGDSLGHAGPSHASARGGIAAGRPDSGESERPRSLPDVNEPESGRPGSTGAGSTGAGSTGAGSGSSRGSNFPGGSEPGTSGSLSTGSADGERAGSGSDERSAEWRAWRERSLRAVKRGQVVPGFVPVLIAPTTHAWVAEQLATATTPDAVRAVFEAARERETEADTEAAHLAEPLAEPLAEQEVPAVEVLASTERSTDVMDAVLRLMLERATALASAEAVSEVRALKAEIAQQLGA